MCPDLALKTCVFTNSPDEHFILDGHPQVLQVFIADRFSGHGFKFTPVVGEIVADKDAPDLFAATFPAGTLVGAPKVRAMEIIDELEPERRGVYAGCIGYFGSNGDMDTCIALRTGVIKDGLLYIQAGGGVVADSDPESEYQESCNKAQALIFAAVLDMAGSPWPLVFLSMAATRVVSGLMISRVKV